MFSLPVCIFIFILCFICHSSPAISLFVLSFVVQTSLYQRVSGTSFQEFRLSFYHFLSKLFDQDRYYGLRYEPDNFHMILRAINKSYIHFKFKKNQTGGDVTFALLETIWDQSYEPKARRTVMTFNCFKGSPFVFLNKNRYYLGIKFSTRYDLRKIVYLIQDQLEAIHIRLLTRHRCRK